MKFNFTKFTLPALLIVASIPAFADEEPAVVKLSDGTTTTWSAFAAALKTPPTVTGLIGNIDDLPNSNTAKASYNSAKSKVENDETDLATKKAAVLYDPEATTHPKLVQDSITAASELAKAQKDLDSYIENNVTEKKEAYENAEKNLATWKSQLAAYNQDVSKYTGQVTSLGSQLTKAEKDLDAAQKAYDAVAESEDITTYVDWLTPIKTAADSYSKAWASQLKGTNVTINIYYKISNTEIAPGLGIYTKFLEISFTKPSIYDEANGWKTATTTQAFLLALYDSGKQISFDGIEVYLGENLKDLKENDAESTIQVDVPSANTQIISKAVDAVNKLSETNGYFKKTTTITHNDPDGKLEQAVIDAKNKVTGIESQKDTADENLATANENVSTTEAKIEGYTVTKGEDGLTEQERLKNAWDDAVENQDNSDAAKAVAAAEAKVATANSAIETARKAVTTAEQKLATDNETLATATAVAQAAANEAANEAATAAARALYNDVTLTDDLTVKESLGTTDYAGRINGLYHVLTIENGPLFDEFTGKFNNIAINGRLAQDASAGNFVDVAVWTGSEGRYYNDEGTRTNYTTIQTLGYAAREYYGVDFSSKTLTNVEDDPTSKLYNITTKNVASSNNKQYYVQVNAQKQLIKSDNAPVNLITKDNTIFAQCADDDIAGRGAANVYYGEEDSYACDAVVITDKVAFYAPADIEAEKLTYSRTFAKGWNSVCVPFELKYTSGIDALCIYDRETPEKFYFTKVSESIPANTPVLMHTTKEVTLSFTSAITIDQTPVDQIVDKEGKNDFNNSTSYGTFKTANPGMFKGEYESYKVYGLRNIDDQANFQSARATATFAPFRMAIASEIVSTQAEAQASPRSIVIIDEKGVEIGGDFSDIEIVEMDAPSFTVAGGQGEIIITSGADLGKVDIYNLNGMLIEVADVVAGTTTVNVSKGMYIVMGQKVVVK